MHQKPRAPLSPPLNGRTPSMRIAAIPVGLLGLAFLVAALWLMILTSDYFSGSDYAPNSGSMPSYRVGNIEADGSGVFAPPVLLLFVSAFLLKFAFNLWRDP